VHGDDWLDNSPSDWSCLFCFPLLWSLLLFLGIASPSTLFACSSLSQVLLFWELRLKQHAYLLLLFRMCGYLSSIVPTLEILKKLH
jgi:hypothetical protein